MYRLAFLRELTGAAREIEADVVAQISLTITRTFTDILLNRKLLDPADTLNNAMLQTPPHHANHNLFIFKVSAILWVNFELKFCLTYYICLLWA